MQMNTLVEKGAAYYSSLLSYYLFNLNYHKGLFTI